MASSSRKREAPDFIVIEDNDKDNEVEGKGNRSHMNFSGSEYCYLSAQHGSGDPDQEPSKPLGDSSNEEDCVIVEPSNSRWPSSLGGRLPGARKRPRQGVRRQYNLRKKITKPSEFLDSDIVIDLNGTVQRDWEEAALRRRMGKLYNTSNFGAESEESASFSCQAKHERRQSFMGRRRGGAHWLSNPKQTDQSNPSGVSPACAGTTDREEMAVEQRSSYPGGVDAQSAGNPSASRGSPVAANSSDEGVQAVFDQQGSNPVGSGTRLDDVAEATSLAETVPPVSVGCDVASSAKGPDTIVTDADVLGRENTQKTEEDVRDVRASRILVDPHLGNTKDTEAAINLKDGDPMVSRREKIKETEEFRQAVAEEWARRKMELQKQAQEAARERKRRKVAAERKLGMEVRQRQRLEEIRQSQLKEEQTLDLKERLRGRTHAKFERLGASCRDMATLLRRLGIAVDGGAFPTTQHVNAAYKKALLRFHPDRIGALMKGDPSDQVEAEETFKLISRMKRILPPTTAARHHT